MEKLNIEVTHKGLDYYKVTIDGEDVEVNISTGSSLNSLIKAIHTMVGYYRR